MNLFGYIWEIAINVVEAMLFIYLLTQTLSLKPAKKIQFIIGIILRIIGISFLNFIIKDSTISLILLFIYDIIFTVSLFSNSISEKILRGGSYVLIAIIADKITFGVANVFTDFELKDLILTGEERFIMSVIYLIFCMILVGIFIHDKKEGHYFPIWFRIIFVSLICVGIVVSDQLLNLIIVADFKEMGSFFIPRLEMAGYIFLFVLFGFAIVIEYSGYVLHQNENLRQKNIMYELEKRHYEMLDTTVSMLRTWRHDSLTHLQIIYNLTEQQNYEELLIYLKQLENELCKTTKLIHTGNSILDALISVKAMEMDKEEINFHYEIYLSSTLPFEETDFVSLTGNLLNNAIYSCKSILDNKKRYINFIIKPYQEMLYICVTNSATGNYKYDNKGNLKSTTPKGQGIGLKRVQEIVKSAGGFCKIYPESDEFRIVIMVPMPISERKNNDGD